MSFNKNLCRKIIAAATALSMVFAASGCGESTSWIASADNLDINSGIYIFYQTEAYNEATAKLKKENEDLDISDVKLLKTMSVENTDISEWINSKAQKQLKVFAAVNEKFDELGLELTAEEQENIKLTSETYWQYYASQYEVNGIGQDSFRQLVEFDFKKEKVFLHYYGEGGEKECQDNEIISYLEGNYARVKTIKFSFTDASGEALDDAGKKDVKKLAEEYKKKAESGKNFDSLIKEYNEYLDKLAAEASEDEETEEPAVTTAAAEDEEPAVTTTAADEDAEEAEVTTAAGDEEESEAVTASEDEEESETTTAAEDEEESETTTAAEDEDEPAVTTVSGEDEEPAVTTAADEKSDETAEDEEDADPYANESIYKKGSEDDGYTPSETLNNAIFNDCKVGQGVELVEDEDGIYLVQRLDISEREDFFEGDKKTGILSEMFKDDFENMAVEWLDSYGFTFNSAAVKRYDPFNIKF